MRLIWPIIIFVAIRDFDHTGSRRSLAYFKSTVEKEGSS
jgi:hypothetical protein